MNGIGKYSDFGDKKNDQNYNTISIITSSPWSNIGVPLIFLIFVRIVRKVLVLRKSGYSWFQ